MKNHKIKKTFDLNVANYSGQERIFVKERIVLYDAKLNVDGNDAAAPLLLAELYRWVNESDGIQVMFQAFDVVNKALVLEDDGEPWLISTSIHNLPSHSTPDQLT